MIEMETMVLGISALGINLPALIAQMINFGLLLLFFSVFLYKPLFKVLDERKKRIEEGLEASEESKRRLSSCVRWLPSIRHIAWSSRRAIGWSRIGVVRNGRTRAIRRSRSWR